MLVAETKSVGDNFGMLVTTPHRRATNMALAQNKYYHTSHHAVEFMNYLRI